VNIAKKAGLKTPRPHGKFKKAADGRIDMTDIDYALGFKHAKRHAIKDLAKRGVRPSQGEYFQKKLIEEMAKRGYATSEADAI